MFSRGAVAATLVLAALVLASGQGAAAPTAPPTNTAEPAISGRAEQGVRLGSSRGTWTGTGPISYRVPVGPLRSRRRTAGRWELRDRLRGDQRSLPARERRRGLRMRVRVTAMNADGSRTAASNPTAVVVGAPANTSTPGVRGTMLVGSTVTADPGSWTGQAADLVLVPLAPVQHAGRKLRLDLGRQRPDVSARRSGREPQDPLQRHRPQLDRLEDRDLGRVGRGDGAPAERRDPVAERRGLHPGDERPLDRTVDRVARPVLAEPGQEQDAAHHRSRPGEGHARVRDTRRARVRPLDPARHRGWRPTGVDRRRLGDVPARAERELPEAKEGLQRPVLREGVPLRRPGLAGIAAYRLVQVRLST